MGRQDYKIKTDTDFYGAYRWIKYKFKNDNLINCPTVDSLEENIKAKEEFEKMATQEALGKKKMTHEDLQGWCDKWMDGANWKKLRASLRQYRTRSVRNNVNVTLSQEAWDILRKLADRDSVTLSDIIISRLKKEYNNL